MLVECISHASLNLVVDSENVTFILTHQSGVTCKLHTDCY